MKSLRFRSPFFTAALAAFLALPAGTPTSACEPACSAIGTVGPDLRPIDADSTLGPWLVGHAAPLPEPATVGLSGPPRVVALTGFVRSPAPPSELTDTTLDLLRRRLDAVRGALDDVERQLSRIQATLQRLEMVQGTPAAPQRERDTAMAPPPAPSMGIGRDRFTAAEPMQPALFSDLAAVGPAWEFESAPLGVDEMGPPAPQLAAVPGAAATAGWMPSGRLVELFLQSAAVAFLATVLLVPFGCWLTSSAMSRRARRRGASAA